MPLHAVDYIALKSTLSLSFRERELLVALMFSFSLFLLLLLQYLLVLFLFVRALPVAYMHGRLQLLTFNLNPLLEYYSRVLVLLR
jgi:hypothetical protein